LGLYIANDVIWAISLERIGVFLLYVDYWNFDKWSYVRGEEYFKSAGKSRMECSKLCTYVLKVPSATCDFLS
jgi:hypothetical protein